MDLRKAVQKDAESLVALINRAFTVERFFIDEDRLNLAEVESRLKSGEFLIGEEEGRMVACVYLERKGDRAYLGLLSVEPGEQGKGRGSGMMRAAEEHCRRAGCSHLDLRIVNLREELPAFYHRHGYVEDGTSAFPAEHPTKVPCHFVHMTKRLGE